ncbi:NIL domain-containing protein [Nostoc sp. UIC 10607]|uniref:NIL domain-containing protein n=1 Tax=Nostoc sp. UIC 10607 TaxID=3045935 RepID=UPI0039A04174
MISGLVSRYSITVNITTAMLTPTENYGWFDLDLWGKPQQLFSIFNHLKTLQLPLWLDASSLHGHLI